LRVGMSVEASIDTASATADEHEVAQR
jgi:membrane fusion protein (multidrug efflux system)